MVYSCKICSIVEFASDKSLFCVLALLLTSELDGIANRELVMHSCSSVDVMFSSSLSSSWGRSAIDVSYRSDGLLMNLLDSLDVLMLLMRCGLIG